MDFYSHAYPGTSHANVINENQMIYSRWFIYKCSFKIININTYQWCPWGTCRPWHNDINIQMTLFFYFLHLILLSWNDRAVQELGCEEPNFMFFLLRIDILFIHWKGLFILNC